MTSSRVPHWLLAWVPSVLATFSFQEIALPALAGSIEIDDVSPHRCRPNFESKFFVSSNWLANGLVISGKVPAVSVASRVAST